MVILRLTQPDWQTQRATIAAVHVQRTQRHGDGKLLADADTAKIPQDDATKRAAV
jgi:hypothetical protein